MTSKALKNLWNRILVVFLLISLGLSSTPMIGYAAEDENKQKIMVSLGDSYSSGEGIEKFYGQDDDDSKKVKNPDWLAHRSQNAWPGMLTLPSVDGKMADNKGDSWFFVAASGAETKHMLEVFHKDYKRGKYSSCEHDGGKIDKDDLPAQLDIFDELDKKADYVTLTLGGNDVDFAGTITQCVIQSSHLNPSHLIDKLNNTWKDFFANGGVRDKLYDAYLNIAEKPLRQQIRKRQRLP